MSLSKTTLSAIQQAGAAVFAADTALKTSAQDYAMRVNAAMAANPFGLGNDALFENWKLVARLSQTMAGIEEELKKVHQLATELTGDDGPAAHGLPALAAPAAEPLAGVVADIAATDVVAKARKKTSASKATRQVPAQPPSRPAVAAPAASGGNSAKLLQHLEQIMKTKDFVAINQRAAGVATGIPTGSVNAALKKLIATGRLVAGTDGRFKLAK